MIDKLNYVGKTRRLLIFILYMIANQTNEEHGVNRPGGLIQL